MACSCCTIPGRAPQFAEYQETAAPRKIPVVVLDPVK
jgi:hypothetical protein